MSSDPDAEAEEIEADDADEEEQPEVEESEMADVDFDALADEVEEEAGADGEESDVEADDAESDPEVMEPSGESWGDMYVGTLTTLSNAVIDEYGDEDEDHVDEDLARQLHMDEYFDEFMAKRGKSDMPPEQALLLSTTMFLAVVVGTKTDLLSEALGEVSL